MDCPPYSSDLARCDFWLFHKEITLKGKYLLTFLTSNADKVTAKYSRKWFLGMFPVAAFSSHKLHNFKGRVFLGRQQALVQVKQSFALTRIIPGIKLSHPIV
jgi:hypothetical protein